MRIVKTKEFAKWARKESLTDESLIKVIHEMNQGLIGIALGGQIYKKRIALQSGGKRGGARTIIAFVVEDKAFFLYGYSKNQKASLNLRELKSFKMYGEHVIEFNDEELIVATKSGELMEVVYNG